MCLYMDSANAFLAGLQVTDEKNQSEAIDELRRRLLTFANIWRWWRSSISTYTVTSKQPKTSTQAALGFSTQLPHLAQ